MVIDVMIDPMLHYHYHLPYHDDGMVVAAAMMSICLMRKSALRPRSGQIVEAAMMSIRLMRKSALTTEKRPDVPGCS